MTDLDRRGQHRRQHGKGAGKTPGEQRIAKAVSQVDRQVAEARMPPLFEQLEPQTERVDARPGPLRRRFDAFRQRPCQALTPLWPPRQLATEQQEVPDIVSRLANAVGDRVRLELSSRGVQPAQMPEPAAEARSAELPGKKD